MTLKIVTHVERPDLLARWYSVIRQVWPELMAHDPVVNQYWDDLEELFPECQTYLIDDESDELVGKGNAVPFAWDGTDEGLPTHSAGMPQR
jgi:hypothetical protein